MKPSRILGVVFAGVLAAAALAVPAQAQWTAGATLGWGKASYDTYAPYRHGRSWYGWGGSWGPCSTGACLDNPYLRRLIQREMAQLEHLRELDEQAQRGLHSYGTPPYGGRRDWPPPTPEAQVQPAYRGSGEIRPEFSFTGQPRQERAGPRR